ncbi:MAG: endo 2 [Bacteroidota bacterium]|nr:endo 2 [Bacteroidota bacterium]
MKTKIQLFIMFTMACCMICCKKTSTTTTGTNQPVKDIDGNIYDTIKIGTQVWMVQNLKTARYNDGADIPNVPDSAQWKNSTTGAYCYYNNDSTNNATHGKLYNWYAVNTGKLAPAGWHVPTDAEWDILVAYLGGDSLAGVKMRATTLWIPSPGVTSTNSSGFTAYPYGFRNSYNSSFTALNSFGFFWSSTGYSTIIAWARYMYFGDAHLISDNSNKADGSSVRCLRD